MKPNTTAPYKYQ